MKEVMTNAKIPATEESRKALYENMGITIKSFEPILKKWILTQRGLDSNNDAHKIFEALLSLSIFSSYFAIEMATILRSCFRAKLLAEKRYNIKYVNCAINEAYKYLYGFDNPDKQTQQRSKLWKSLRRIDNPELQQDLGSLERSIIRLAEDGVADKDRRDIGFHYDENPVLVYNMLNRLSEEEECQRMIRFMRVLDEISKFLHKWLGKYVVYVEVESDYFFAISEVDFFKHNKEKLLDVMQNAIKTHSKRLDDAAQRQGLPERMGQFLVNAPKESIDTIRNVVALEQAAMQIQFILIDLASASTAYLTAEHTIEKQLSLKQITIIIYEGFNKLYGVYDSGAQESFWTRLITPIVAENQDEQLHRQFDVLVGELTKLKSQIQKTKRQRHLSVHCDRGKGIPAVYDMLHNINPLEILQQAADIVEFLPKVLTFFTSCLRTIGQKNDVAHQKRMAPIYEVIDNILNLLEHQPDTPQKQQLITFLTKFKTGEFMDDLIKRAKTNRHVEKVDNAQILT